MLQITALAVLFLLLCYAVVKSIAFTPPIRGENTLVSLETVEIGGVRQSILIRTTDTNNPILLYLHSGPGTTELVAFRHFHPELEKYFTVVYWEQRGTGKSYQASQKGNLTIDRLVCDAGELIRYLLKRFNQPKLFLVGHSWGTALGLLTAERYPDLLWAYAGSGQEVAPAEGEKLSYEWTLRAAKQTRNTAAQQELEKINKNFPYLTVDGNADWYKDLTTERKWLVTLGGEAARNSTFSMYVAPAWGLSEYTLADFIRFAQGSAYSLRTLWPEVMRLDFRKNLRTVKIPVFFLQGKQDWNTPSALVEEYYSELDAPHKELIWFETSGHHPMVEEPELYDSVLIAKLLSIAGK